MICCIFFAVVFFHMYYIDNITIYFLYICINFDITFSDEEHVF